MHERIIVIGAGSTGSSISYYLSRSGNTVSVIDRGSVACGNTGKSSALIRTHYSNELLAIMARYSLEVFENFGDVGYSGFTKTGMIFPFHGGDCDIARKNVRMLRSVGIHEEEMSPETLKRFYPDIDLENFDYIAYEPDSGYADPVATSNSFISGAISLGASALWNSEVSKVTQVSNAVTAHLKDGKEITGDRIILATNIWTNELLLRSGVDESHLPPITSSRHNIIYVRRPEEYMGIKPTLWDPPNLAYYKMEGRSLTAIGSLDPDIDRKPVNMDESQPETATQEFMEEYLGKLTSRLPAMSNATLVSSLTGFYDMTPDGQAIVDSLSDLGMDRIYLCAGLSGHGFKLSPAFGKMVSDMISGADPELSEMDWRPFSMRRFKDRKLIRSLYEDIGTIY